MAHELIARVDRHDVALGLPVTPVAGGTHQEGFDVRLHGGQLRVGPDQIGPGVEWELRLGGARRAGVEGGDPLELRIEEEECDADRYLQAVPLGWCELKVAERQVALGHAAEVVAARPLRLEEEEAPTAGAEEGPGAQVHEVWVLGRDGLGAQLAHLLDPSRLSSRCAGPDALQHRDRVGHRIATSVGHAS